MKVVWFSWAYVVVCVLSLALFGYTTHIRAQDQAKLEELARETNYALCTFRFDLERRYAAALDFYERNPQGIPGVSGADIARSLANQKATLDSLASLSCQ